MADRYDEAVRRLRGQPVPDLWDEIRGRAAKPATEASPAVSEEAAGGASGGEGQGADLDVQSLDDERRRRRPRWPALLAAAAAGVLVVWGGVALLDDSDPTVVTTDPAGPPTSRPPRTITEPSLTTPPPTTEPEPEADGDEADADQEDGGLPPVGDEGVGSGSGEISGCSDLELRSAGDPEDIAGVQQPATPGDPRLPEMFHPGLVGVFESSSTSERAVFVVDRWGFGEEGGRYLTHGSFGDVWLVHDGGQGIVELSTTLNDESCEVTLWSIGLTEDELERFVLSLTLAH